ncbi:MAG TPA: DivIVA domain-containing protein [Micromonosporaceae bacterium]
MPDFLLLVVIALVVAALVFGVGALLTGSDPGLTPVEPEGASRGLPSHRPLVESDVAGARFDTALRGYRMSQVDVAMARAAYDIGFKQEMIETLRAEVSALREGRTEDAEMLRKARESAVGGSPGSSPGDAESSPDAVELPAHPADSASPGPVAPTHSAEAAQPAETAQQTEAAAPAESVKQPE